MRSSQYYTVRSRRTLAFHQATDAQHKSIGSKRERLSYTLISSSSSVNCLSDIDVKHNQKLFTKILGSLRGGSTATDQEEEDSDSEYEEEYDSEEEEEEYDSEEEEESTEDETDTEIDDSTKTSLAASIQSKVSNEPYDTMVTPPPMQQMLLSLSVMFLSQRIDIFSPRVVTIARAAFVTYIIAVQLFLFYVRTRVKHINDRTEIIISNPLSSLVQGMQKDSNNAMIKSLTSQMLTTHTTIYEYDMQQIKSMQSGLLMPMVFIYFLHFRMKQMQPLLMQTVSGVMNLVYSPLWQVYVLGKNLERPFGKMNGGLNGFMGENGTGDDSSTEVNSSDDIAKEEEEESKEDEEEDEETEVEVEENDSTEEDGESDDESEEPEEE